MRTIVFDMTADRQIYPTIFGGYVGEHNATRLEVRLPQRMIDPAFDVYRFSFETSIGEVIFSLPCPLVDGSVSTNIWKQLTIGSPLKFNVCAFSVEDDVTKVLEKTGAVTLKLSKDIQGHEVDANIVQEYTESEFEKLLNDSIILAQTAAETANVSSASANTAAASANTAAARAEKSIINVNAISKSHDRRITNLEYAAKGYLYRDEVDSTEAYTKAVPSDAMPYAMLNSIGGKSVCWNVIVYKDEYVTRFAPPAGTRIISGHKYFLKGKISLGNPERRPVAYVYTKIDGVNKIIGRTDQYSGKNIFTSDVDVVSDGVDDSTMWIYAGGLEGNSLTDIFLIDLTQLFGSGNEPATTDDHRIAWVESYAEAHKEYNTGEIISADVDKVISHAPDVYDLNSTIYSEGLTEGSVSGQFTYDGVTYDSFEPQALINGHILAFSTKDGNNYVEIPLNNVVTDANNCLISGDLPYPVSIEVSSADQAFLDWLANNAKKQAIDEVVIPDAVRNLPGYGWSAGSVCNEVDFENKKYIQRVGRLIKAVSEMNNLEDYPGWLNSGASELVGKEKSIVELCTFELGVGKLVSFNTRNTNDVLFLSYVNYGLTQTQWKEQYPDAVFHFYIPLREPIVTDLSDILSADTFVKVEAGGYLEIHNIESLETPNTETFLIDLTTGGSTNEQAG